jgi:hypothetical protein
MMAVEIMIARQLTYFSAREKDAERRCDLEAGMAKLLGARVAWACADNALQIHGGNGFAMEYPVSRVLCDARILNIFEGAAEIQAQVIAHWCATWPLPAPYPNSTRIAPSAIRPMIPSFCSADRLTKDQDADRRGKDNRRLAQGGGLTHFVQPDRQQERSERQWPRLIAPKTPRHGQIGQRRPVGRRHPPVARHRRSMENRSRLA